MKLILVRHAETEWNLDGIIQGHSDSSLTCRGLRETSVLLAAFSASEYQIERVYASPLGRAWQMGQSLAEHFRCSLTAEPALKEQAFGQFEGMPLELLRQKHPNDANALFRLDAEYCPPGGGVTGACFSASYAFFTKPGRYFITSTNNMYCVSRACQSGHSGNS